MTDRKAHGKSRQARPDTSRKGVLRGVFTRQNLAVGWSSTWLGLAAGLPVIALVYLAYLLAAPLLFLAVWVAPMLAWSWRRIETRSPLGRSFLTILVAGWVVFCPLNYTFNLSCRRAVRVHRGIEVGTLRYLSGYISFAIVWGATWLITGFPLILLLEYGGAPEPAQWTLFGIWLILTPIVTLPIFGRLINHIADRRRSLSDLDTPQRTGATAPPMERRADAAAHRSAVRQHNKP